MVIDLTKPLRLPKAFTDRLRTLDELCRKHYHLESMFKYSCVLELVKDIDKHCSERKVVGIHYTRAIPEQIKERGLLVRNGSEIRNTFLTEHGHRFSLNEIDFIKSCWSDFFTEEYCPARDKRIFFNFTEVALGNSSSKFLIGLYGGEQIMMCFDFDDSIGTKLSEIGKPLLIRCALNPSKVKTFTEYPWGKILVSSYHKLINPEACIFDQDGYQSIAVTRDDIVNIEVLPE